MKTILVSSTSEALRAARAEFAQGEKFIIVEGAATVGGVMFEAQFGPLLMHNSERYVEILANDVEAAKAKLQ